MTFRHHDKFERLCRNMREGSATSGYTGLYCVFGDPVQHSFSPRLHNKAFDKANIDGVYVAFTANEKTIEAPLL